MSSYKIETPKYFFKIFTALCLVWFGLMCIAIVIVLMGNQKALAFINIFLVILVLNLLAILIGKRLLVEVNGSEVKVHYLLKKAKTFDFSEMTRAKKGSGNQLVVYKDNKKIMQLDPNLVNLEKFMKELENHGIEIEAY